MSPLVKDRSKLLSYAEIAVIVVLACVPLFFSFPYRINIFLSWEGAYRMSEGQLPFRDFGTPLGGFYWVIPGIFFKIFGAKMITLVKAQVLINILSGLAFRSILRSLSVQPGVRFVSVLVYCVSFSFFNFWPWYNHSVIVYEFIALAFLLRGLLADSKRRELIQLSLAGLFTTLSFFTKQDAGGMALLIGGALALAVAIRDRRWRPLLIYISSFIVFMLLYIVPFLGSGIGYWFNHGQEPHSARISAFEIADEFMANSAWIRFYLFVVLFLLVVRYKNLRELLTSRTELLFVLLTLGVLVEAAIFQVTSYTPPDNNIFFHSFAIVFILSSVSRMLTVDTRRPVFIGVLTIGVLLWWANVFYKYLQPALAARFAPTSVRVSKSGENVVNRKTYMIGEGTDTTSGSSREDWAYASDLPSFDRISMPKSTIDGMHRLISMNAAQGGPKQKVLNMTELTPLAKEMHFDLETGSGYPLWFHLGVGMFNKQAAMFEERIGKQQYDLILFEYIPTLNNFYPFRIHDSLQVHYNKVDSFDAPRVKYSRAVIEVYRKK